MTILLASASPRRAEILRLAGFSFRVAPSDVDETRYAAESAEEYVCRLARTKAEASAPQEAEIVLAADTTVRVGSEILEKPLDAEDARRMLRLLSGREHDVLTGICVRRGGEYVVDYSVTRVTVSRLTEEDIAGYIESGEPMGKAGAYAIQGLAAKFIERLEGCYFNVMGLPISLVWRRLRELQPH